MAAHHAVSYTHLDVYKRQDVPCVGYRIHTPDDKTMTIATDLGTLTPPCLLYTSSSQVHRVERKLPSKLKVAKKKGLTVPEGYVEIEA